MILFIAGIKHSGKSTMARLLSEDEGARLIDLDEEIEKDLGGVSIRDFFRIRGKSAFMKKEASVIKEIIASLEKEENIVISLGGGVSDNREVMKIVKEHGTLVYIRRDEKDVYQKVMEKGLPPFLDKNDSEGSFHELYLRRDKIYLDQADIIVNLGPYGDKKEAYGLMKKTLKENGYAF